jgi:hypothetical protein
MKKTFDFWSFSVFRISDKRLCTCTTNCSQYLLTKHSLITTLRFVNENICTKGDSNVDRSSHGPVHHFHTWMAYRSLVWDLRYIVHNSGITLSVFDWLTLITVSLNFSGVSYGGDKGPGTSVSRVSR